MSLRILGCLLTVITVALLKLPQTPASGQAEEAATEPRWEYQVVTMDPLRCAVEDAINTSLNAHGKQGWELVSYQQGAASFPTKAQGELLFRPAATGPGKEVSPQLADSFQGTIDFKMAEPQPGACRLVFKRQLRLPAKSQPPEE